jgi:hypothetical protein
MTNGLAQRRLWQMRIYPIKLVDQECLVRPFPGQNSHFMLLFKFSHVVRLYRGNTVRPALAVVINRFIIQQFHIELVYLGLIGLFYQ